MIRRKQNGDKKVIKVRGTSAYDEALYFLTPKARTVREVENHLDECNHSEMEIFDAVERLKNAGLIDDEKYAADFIQTRLNSKPISKMKIREQLISHFIDVEIINNAIAGIDDEVELNNARTVAEKYFRQFEKIDSAERLRRVALRLISRGFMHDDIKTVLRELEDND